MTDLNSTLSAVKVFAPASCANLAVGFDVLGTSVDNIGDTIYLKRRHDQKIVIQRISGDKGAEKIPYDIHKNIVSAIILKMREDYAIATGFDIFLEKGVPLSSGMGGSASSAVGAAYAFSYFLNQSLSYKTIASYAIFGESIASGHGHADNVVPSLYGGLCLIKSINPLYIIHLPKVNLKFVLVHPDFEIKTQLARQALERSYTITDLVEYGSNLAGFVASLYERDIELFKSSMQEVLIENHRKFLIPGFDQIKEQAFAEGALACSISGAGPAIFAITQTESKAACVGQALVKQFNNNQYDARFWVTDLHAQGVQLIHLDKN